VPVRGGEVGRDRCVRNGPGVEAFTPGSGLGNGRDQLHRRRNGPAELLVVGGLPLDRGGGLVRRAAPQHSEGVAVPDALGQDEPGVERMCVE
jgi:hypothetical protein